MARQKTHFVIITEPRSGSYHLQSLLDSAADISCHGEIFKKNRVEVAAELIRELGLTRHCIAERDAKPLLFVNQLRALCAQYPAFGFKAFWSQLEPHKPVIDAIVNNGAWKKVLLRRNPLHTYASLLRARQTKVWVEKRTAATGTSAVGRVRVDFGADSFARHLAYHQRVREKHQALMSAQPDACFAIDYRDLGSSARLGALLAFLGSRASPAQLVSEYQKQHRGPLLDGFTNPEALVAYLHGQGLAGLLDDDEAAW